MAFLVLEIHLFCAVIFFGYVFADAIFVRSKQERSAILLRAACVCAAAFVLLLASGGVLAMEFFKHASSAAKALFIGKLAILALMCALTGVSIFYARKAKTSAKINESAEQNPAESEEQNPAESAAQNQPENPEQNQLNPFARFLLQYAHQIAIILSALIIICAKLMQILR